jgi:dGTPase
MGGDDDGYVSDVRAALERALAAGLAGHEFWRALMGADPRVVERLLAEEPIRGQMEAPASKRHDAARRYAAELPLALPAPDPMRSQWWFTLDAVQSLSAKARALSTDGSAAFLGAPTVGHHYAVCYEAETTILDADPDVVEAVGKAIERVRKDGWIGEQYDANDELPNQLSMQHAVAVLDPPWYPSLIRLFLSRARSLVRDSGFLVCVIPPLLTRPGLLGERTDLLSELQTAGYRIVALEPQAVTYDVPSFELAAYQDIPIFTGRSWRAGDVLTVQVVGACEPLPIKGEVERQTINIFSRDRSKQRFFLDESRVDPEMRDWASSVPEFERTVSTRSYDISRIAAWGSNRKAVEVRDASIANLVLKAWERGASKDEATALLVEQSLSQEEAERAVQDIHDGLALGTEEPGASWRRTPDEMEDVRQKALSSLGSQPSSRQHPHVDDDFRLSFQRDRDRILWSHSFRRLASKTQVFPVDSDDELRRRLTHSVEVMQLADTIARAFGLDPDLTQAGALAHDLGHAPFGHAGEYALNSVLDQIDRRLGGFNHYEHGADVVRWLEDAYMSPGIGGFPGLNLTRGTVECILKHTYYRSGHPLGQTEVLQRSKHREIDDTYGSLEAQAVRLADKLSYLISDLEDGIRLTAIVAEDLRRCRLFDRPPIDMRQTEGESLLERFVSQRRALLRVLMEDVLVATDVRLAHLGTVQAVRDATEYTVAFSPTIQAEFEEIWTELQSGTLHKAGRVVQANFQAGAMVTRLFLVCMLRPELVDAGFRRSHERLRGTEYLAHYRSLLESDVVSIPKDLVSSLAVDRMIGSELTVEADSFVVPAHDLVLAKDYVASLTDTRAQAEYARLVP